MKIYVSILETLKDLDTSETDRLYQSMIEKAKFIPATVKDNFPMYIFPDGKILGSFGYGEDDGDDEFTQPHRGLYHTSIYNASSKYIKNINTHPMLDEQLATYHNLVVIVPMDEEGAVIIPNKVEPTPAQQEVIKQLRRMGYTMETWDTLENVPDEQRNRLADRF